MKADILKQGEDNPETTEVDEGLWVNRQDPDSGEILRVWQPNPETSEPDDPSVTELDSIKCLARGIIDGGIRVAGTTERFSEIYDADDYVKLWFSAGVILTRRDRVTNIRTSKGIIAWREEEKEGSPPTVFGVLGVTPVMDPFGNHIENVALLERIETQ